MRRCGRLSVREASRLLHLSERQVRRLKRRYQPDSIDWVHHGNLGRSMPWAANAWSPPITPSPWAHTLALPPLPGHRGYAGETLELSHQLDGTMRVYRGDALLVALPLPLEEHAQRRPAPITSAQKRKTPMPRIYNLSGRPALAAVT
jgi:hypothetical protein